MYTLSPYKINLKKWIWKTQIYRKIDWSHTKIFPLKWIWTLSSSFAVSVLGCKHQAKRNWKFFSASWKNFCQSSFTVKIFERPVSFMQYENIYVKAYIFLKDQIWKTFCISAVVKPQNRCVQFSQTNIFHKCHTCKTCHFHEIGKYVFKRLTFSTNVTSERLLNFMK